MLLLLSVGSVAAVQAGTTWTSPITNAVAWTKAGSPHTWSGTLTVGAGGLVTIEAGAVVQYSSGQDLVVVAGGQILAVGTADDPISIGGVSESARGGELYVQSENASEFRFCHFANLSHIHVMATSPQGNPLFEHSIFRKFSAHIFQLNDAPARILHCIFRDNPAEVYGVYMACSSFSDETCPTIWYNAFEQYGLLVTAPNYGTVAMKDYDFFRYNRVGGGIGILFAGDRYPGFSRFRLLDCDLGNASPSLSLQSTPGWDGGMNAMSIERCNLSTLVRSTMNVSAITNLANNYWGTTNMSMIAAALFGGEFSTNVTLPISTTNVFPQADVDGSDNGDRTRQADADLVKKYIVGMTNLNAQQFSIADVDHNGKVDARDALIIESYVNGLIWKLPVP